MYTLLVLSLGLLAAPTASAQDTTTLIVTATPDPRDCAWPMCGGWWIEAVNRARTPCVDGVLRRKCYVAQIDWSPLGLSPAEEADLVAKTSAGLSLLEATVTELMFYGTPYWSLEAQRSWVDPHP